MEVHFGMDPIVAQIEQAQFLKTIPKKETQVLWFAFLNQLVDTHLWTFLWSGLRDVFGSSVEQFGF